MPSETLSRSKSGTTTFWLNFVIPGAGHLYASSGHLGGGLVAGNVLCGILGAFLIVPWIGSLIIWLYAMATSREVTEDYNSSMQAAIRLQEEAAMKLQNEQEAVVLAQVTDEALMVSGQLLARKLSKVGALLNAGVISESESVLQKQKIIQAALAGWTTEDFADFLSPFAPLMGDGTITREEMQSIKNTHAAILRS